MPSNRKSTDGRAARRDRTRGALLAAAARLLERGEKPRLAAVAEEAGVSRATAYRHFPSEQALLLEAPLAQRFAAPEDVLADHEDAPVLDRVLAVHRYVYGYAVDHEAHFRRFLGAVHEQAARDGGAGPPRAGRRRSMFELALAPARGTVPAATLRRLRDSLVGMTGIDALAVMRDVCGLSAPAGRKLMEWSIRTLVEAVLGEDDRS